QADPTRPVKEASDFREHPYPGWYYGHLRDFLALPGAPLPSEFGAQALPRAELLRKIFKEKAWPPDFSLWSYHNFQPHETFRVAGVRMGESLEEFVEQSQAYQAHLIRFAIHAYRRAKGRVTGYFHFMLVEPWEGITWAVVDVERVPKRGYFALKEASSPVLLSLEPYRETLAPGDFPLMEAWLISDLDEALEVEVRLWVEGEAHLALPSLRVQLGPSEARRFFHLMELWESPMAQKTRWARPGEMLKALPFGKYRLVGEVWQEKRISRDEFAFRLAPPLGL
ncbi:MAG: beta-galactosidase, partial [Thermoleophilia bacterium]